MNGSALSSGPCSCFGEDPEQLTSKTSKITIELEDRS